MRTLQPLRSALLLGVLLAVGVFGRLCFGHGEGPKPPPTPPTPGYPMDLKRERVVPPRWSWIHWWEANRDPSLKIVTQRQFSQKPEAQTLQGYRDRAVKALLASTNLNAWEVRGAAALALGRMNEKAACDTLLRMVAGDPDERVRMTALVALGLVDSPQARDFLLGSKYPTDTLLEAGCSGLGLLRQADEAKVLATLQQGTGDARPGVATISAWGIRHRPDAANIRFLQAVLQKSKSPWLASEAILALGDQGDPAAVKFLADVLLATRQASALAAWEALEMRDLEVGRLASDKVRVVPGDLEKISAAYKKFADWREMGPNGLPSTTGNLTIYTKVGIEKVYLTTLRASAAVALGRIRQPQAQQALLAALEVRDDKYTDLFKGFAIMALGQTGDKDILPPLLEYLAPKFKDDRRKTVPEMESPLRGFAALALGLYARPRDTPQGPVDPPMYERVCQALGERLADRDEYAEVRAACAMGLGLTGRTECLRLIHAAQASAPFSDELLIGYTMLASGMLGDRNILEPARRFLAPGNDREDTSGILGRRAAVLALALLDSAEAIPILIGAWHLSYHVNREVAVAFSLCGAYNVTDPLVKLLGESENALERAFAAKCLGELFSQERPQRLAWFINDSNYTVKNRRMMPYQALANEFLYTYLIPCFGDQWQ